MLIKKKRFPASHHIQIMSALLARNLSSCVCEFISVSDGACCARQPGSSGATLCGQGTVCPLSCCFEFTTNLTAASSLIHRSRWRRARLFRVVFCPFSFSLFFLFGEAAVREARLLPGRPRPGRRQRGEDN